MIYVASPYSHPDADIRKMRLAQTAKYINDLYQRGLVAVSPVLHCEQIERMCRTPGSFEHWKTFCFHLIGVSSQLHVLMLPEWEESAGVRAEVLAADRAGIPVKYIDMQ